MRTLFTKLFNELMLLFEVQMLLDEKFGRDLGGLVMSFFKEDPAPFEWRQDDQILYNPWNHLCEVDPLAGVDLPLFSP